MEQNKKVLIIEDDQEINQLLQVIVAKNDLEAIAAYSGTEALLQLNSQGFDLVLLDLMLPGISGEELIARIREVSLVPIIVISAKKDLADKVSVLKIGADDYITKPFNEEEVAVRMEVQLRRSTANAVVDNELSWKGLVLNTDKLTAILEGCPLTLTNAEFDILLLLIQRPEQAFSKRHIYEKIWKGVYVGDDNTISVHVSNIRKKISAVTSDEYIKTVWGIGFMLV